MCLNCTPLAATLENDWKVHHCQAPDVLGDLLWLQRHPGSIDPNSWVLGSKVQGNAQAFGGVWEILCWTPLGGSRGKRRRFEELIGQSKEDPKGRQQLIFWNNKETPGRSEK